MPVVFCETRKLAEDWTYRFLSAAYVWAGDTVADPSSSTAEELAPVSTPTTAEVRTWARSQDIHVPDRGRLRPEVLLAWHSAHQ